MFKLTKLIALWPHATAADRERLAQTLRAAGQSDGRIRRVLFQPMMERSMCAGGYMWHLQFASEDDYRAVIRGHAWRDTVGRALDCDPVSHVDSAAYRPERGQVREPGIRKGVYRALFVAARPGVPARQVRQFEDEMCEMPDYIPAIRNWGFNRVVEAGGARAWTHVWEQEFQDVGGLHGPYMMHPHHWAFIDRWYNDECPDWTVDKRLCHTFCAFDDSMFAPLP
jgi:hypothetical protein